MKRVCSVLLVAMLVILLAIPVSAADRHNPYVDVKADRFEEAILWASYEGITTGTGDGTTFSPENPCTRKQIVTFLWRAAGEPEPKSMENPFTDVKSDRFEKAILWAYYEGITTGTGDGSTFSPENTCTRKQIVTFLWRYYGEPAPESTEITFTDVKNDRFAPAILWAAEQKITTGTGDGSTFEPESPCTRKQIVTFLWRAAGEPAIKGTEDNPEMILLEDVPGTYDAKVGPGETVYFCGYLNGMNLSVEGVDFSINGQEPVDGKLEMALTSPNPRFPVTLQISNSSEQAAVYELQLSYPVGTMMNPEVLEELSWHHVSLPEGDNQGYYYSYTAPADGSITMYCASVTEGATANIIVNNLTSYAYLSLLENGVDNNGLELQFDVKEGDELVIQLAVMPNDDWQVPAADISWVGSFTYPLGSEQNPIYPEFVWNEAGSEASATVTIPANTTKYFACWGAGMELYVDGEYAGVLQASGMGRVPAVFVGANDTAEEVTRTFTICYPVGSMMNPEVLEELSWHNLSLPEGDNQGYFYAYTAPADGTITLYIGSAPEGVEANIVVNNNTSYVTKTLLADGVDNNGLELTMDVKAGDELVLNVAVMPNDDWQIPAANITWAGTFNYPLGTKDNPEFPEFVWNDAGSEATATVTVPANSTRYFGVWGAGMELYVNGEYQGILTAEGMGRAPATFSFTNPDSTEMVIDLKIAYPKGHMMNPEILGDISEIHANIPAGNDQGYYYTLTALGDGTLKLTCPTVDGITYDVILTNQTTWQSAWLNESTDGTVSVNVSALDVVTIQVVAVPDDQWQYPALDVVLTGEAALAAPSDPVTVVNAGYALQNYQTLPYTATLTGEITEITEAYSSQFKNITVVIAIEGAEDKPITCYRMKGEGADSLAVGDTITVTGTIKNYKGTIEFDTGCSLDAVVKGEGETPVAPENPVDIVNAAYELAEGEALPYSATLTGEVIDITEPYSSQYKNITIVIAVEGAENKPITCYRLKGEGADTLAVGDTVTVTGTIKNYSGIIEFISGCTLDNVVKGAGETPVAPEDPLEIVGAAYELAVGEALPYTATLTGEITGITDAYSEQYKNITVVITIEGAEDKPITCYRLKGEGADTLAVGDTITVTGTIKNYNGTIEFISGCTLDSIVKGAVISGGYEADYYTHWQLNENIDRVNEAPHTLENGICTVCGAEITELEYEIWVQTYDEKGNILTWQYYDSQMNRYQTRHWTYDYDELDNLVRMCEFYNGLLYSDEEYTMVSEGVNCITKGTYYEEDGNVRVYIYTYNVQGEVLSEKYWRNDVLMSEIEYEVVEYYGSSPVREVYYNEDGSVTLVVSKYDEEGVLVERTETLDGEFVSEYKCSYLAWPNGELRVWTEVTTVNELGQKEVYKAQSDTAGRVVYEIYYLEEVLQERIDYEYATSIITYEEYVSKETHTFADGSKEVYQYDSTHENIYYSEYDPQGVLVYTCRYRVVDTLITNTVYCYVDDVLIYIEEHTLNGNLEFYRSKYTEYAEDGSYCYYEFDEEGNVTLSKKFDKNGNLIG